MSLYNCYFSLHLVLLFVFTLTGLCCLLNAATVRDTCPLPPRFQTNYDFQWKSKSNEWSNTTAKTASLQLVLSWSPTYCESFSPAVRNKRFQCRDNNTFGIVVHGLWPQAAKVASVRGHPRNCRNETQLSISLVKKFFCLMPDEFLIQSQWEKHGTCHYSTAIEFFNTIEKLYTSLTIPDIRSMTNITAVNIKNSFMELNPKLLTNAVKVTMDAEKRLKEVKICYNLKYQFAKC